MCVFLRNKFSGHIPNALSQEGEGNPSLKLILGGAGAPLYWGTELVLPE